MSTTCQCPKISLPLLTRRRNKLFLVISPIYKTPGWLFTRPTSLLIVDSLLMPQELPPSPHTLSGGSALGPETDACDEVSSVFVRQLRTPEPARSRAVRKLRPADAPDELAGHAYRSVLSACHWRGGLRSVGLAQKMAVRVFSCRHCEHHVRLGSVRCGQCGARTPALNWAGTPAIIFLVIAVAFLVGLSFLAP